MRKIILTVIALVLTGAVWLGYKVYNKIQISKQVAQRYETLPPLPLLNLDSVLAGMPTGSPTVLIYFNSECSLCENEVRVLVENKDKFKNAAVLFISAETLQSVKKFANQYLPEDLTNFKALKADGRDLAETFGQLAVPHIFIYDNQGNLRKEFKGETKPEAIEKYL